MYGDSDRRGSPHTSASPTPTPPRGAALNLKLST